MSQPSDSARPGVAEMTAKPSSKETSPDPVQGNVNDHCVTDRPLDSGEASTGEISKLGDIEVYITKPSDYPHSPSKLLLFLTNGTGIHSSNNQLQADKFAKEGFLVVMPDMFAGDPAPKTTTTTDQEEHPSMIEQVKLRTAETAKAFMIDMWLARHTAETVMPRLNKVIESIRDEFADAIANGGGLYAAGYCFGGKYALQLGHDRAIPVSEGNAEHGEEGPSKEKPVIKVAAIAHGTLVTLDDITGLKVPVSMVCIENDQLFPDEIREEGKTYLETNEIEHEVKVFPNVPHGFAVLGQYKEQHIQSAQETAFGQMLNWLQTH